MEEGYAESSVTLRQSRATWARLICRRCGSPMRILAVITEPQQVRKPRAYKVRPEVRSFSIRARVARCACEGNITKRQLMASIIDLEVVTPATGEAFMEAQPVIHPIPKPTKQAENLLES